MMTKLERAITLLETTRQGLTYTQNATLVEEAISLLKEDRQERQNGKAETLSLSNRRLFESGGSGTEL